jgi:tRNA threonylcarbamoyl adenosine modification protein (Sua5/YciO/YrdC/YwlC family)
MARLSIDPRQPDPTAIAAAVAALRADGVIVYPTDTVYGLGCRIGSAAALERIYRLKRRERRKPMSFICGSLAQVSEYAVMSNHAYRLAKRLLPGPYTLVLPATARAPRVLQSKVRAVGVRIPSHPVTAALVAALGEPITTTSANLSGQATEPTPVEVERALGSGVDVILDAGPLWGDPSTVLDLTGADPVVLRQGAGPWPL